MKGGINNTIQNVLFKSPFDNKSRSFLEKYHSLFTEVNQTKQPEGKYWEKYTDRTFKLTKKFNDDLGLKTIQSQLEQQREHNDIMKKSIPSHMRNSFSSSNKANKTRQRIHRKELLSVLDDSKQRNCIQRDNEKFLKNGIDRDNKYTSAFVNKVCKKFPEFVKDGYLKNKFCVENGNNNRIAKMKNDINIKLNS